MKKILLIDNDVSRLNLFLLNDYRKFTSIIEANKSILDYSHRLGEYAVLLLHKNYMEEGNIVTESVKKFANEAGLKWILFSGEHTRQTTEFVFQQDFYNHLVLFIKHYANTGHIEEDVLRYGKNYFIEEVFKTRYEILKEFIDKEYDQKLELTNTQIDNVKKLLQGKFNPTEIEKSLANLQNPEKYKNINDFIDRLNQLVKSFVDEENENYTF